MQTIGIIIPTCGRTTLQRSIESAMADKGPGDRVLVVGDGPQPRAARMAELLGAEFIPTEPTAWFGNHQMNCGLDLLGTSVDLLYQLDDDDFLSPDCFEVIRKQGAAHPGHVLMTKMTVGQGRPGTYTLWNRPALAPGNVGSGNFVFPSGNPARFNGPDTPDAGHSDFQFMVANFETHPAEKITWVDHVTYFVPARGFGHAPVNP